MGASALVVALCAQACLSFQFGGGALASGRAAPIARSAVAEAPAAEGASASAPLTLAEVSASLGGYSSGSFAAALKELSAVDALKAIDAAFEAGKEGELLGASTAPFAAALERVATTQAPIAALGALVGHTMARVKRAGVSPDDALLSSLAPALLRARKNTECIAAVDAISAKGGGDLRCGIAAASRLDDGAKVRELAELALKEGDVIAAMDDNALKFALKAVAKVGDHRTAFSLVDALPEGRRSAALYHGAITACGRSRPMKGKTAMVLWRRMKAEGLDVPRATYNALLHAAQGAELENATTALLTEMSAKNVSLNVVSYNIALNSLAARGRFKEVLDLLETMETSSIAPTAVTFGTAIHGAAQANNSNAAVALLRAQTKIDIPAGDPAYASALEACVRDPDGAVSASNANAILDILAEDADVNLDRRERIEALARAAVHRGVIDDARLKRDEEILGMVLRNRQAEV